MQLYIAELKAGDKILFSDVNHAMATHLVKRDDQYLQITKVVGKRAEISVLNDVASAGLFLATEMRAGRVDKVAEELRGISPYMAHLANVLEDL